jgi:PHP family Zn ribbon phosphoesterase
MDHQFKEDRKTVPTLKISSISPKENISGTYLIFRLFARGRATSKHGGGGRYGAVLEFKGEQFFKKRGSSKEEQANKKIKTPL